MQGEAGRPGEAGRGRSGSLAGMFWIVVGVVIAGNVLDWWNISLFFRGWWTLFIILPCGAQVLRKGFHSGAGFGLVVGLLLLFSQWNLFSIGWAVKLLIPVLLILYGIKIVMRGTSFRRTTVDHIPDGYAEEANCSGIFQNKEIHYPEDEFFGSEVNAIFGGADLDLRSALIDEDVTISATAIFGGIDIKLPEDVNVKVSSTGIFGGTDNGIKRPANPEWPTVYIQATAVFGGIDIK